MENQVEKLIHELDSIPPKETLGGDHIVQTDKQIDINSLRRGTRMKIKGTKSATNLVDYVGKDRQIEAMLTEGLRLGAIKSSDLEERGIIPKRLMLGKRVALELPPLDHLQKAQVLSLILSKSGFRYGDVQYVYRLHNVVLSRKSIHHIDREGRYLSSFDPMDLLDALGAAAREELASHAGAPLQPIFSRMFVLSSGPIRPPTLSTTREESMKLTLQENETPTILSAIQVPAEKPSNPEPKPRPSRFFISYSSRDESVAVRIADSLKEAGLEYWLDKKDIVIGQPILDRLREGVTRESDYVLIMLSNNSVSSEWCRLELRMAYEKEMTLGRVVVLPIRIDQASLPEEVKTKKYYQLDPSNEKSIHSLVEEIKALMRTYSK